MPAGIRKSTEAVDTPCPACIDTRMRGVERANDPMVGWNEAENILDKLLRGDTNEKIP